MRDVTDVSAKRTYVRVMISLIVAAIGVIVLVIARLTRRGADLITPRAYGKRYGGAPGADSENKPDGR